MMLLPGAKGNTIAATRSEVLDLRTAALMTDFDTTTILQATTVKPVRLTTTQYEWAVSKRPLVFDGASAKLVIAEDEIKTTLAQSFFETGDDASAVLQRVIGSMERSMRHGRLNHAPRCMAGTRALLGRDAEPRDLLRIVELRPLTKLDEVVVGTSLNGDPITAPHAAMWEGAIEAVPNGRIQ